MYTDAQNRPSNNQSLVSGTGTVVSTDSIDTLAANRMIGRGHPMRAVAHLSTALAGAGSSVQAQFIESANSDLSSPTVLASGPVVAVADATAGRELIDVPVPDTARRYIGFQYVITGAAVTAGTVSAHLVAGTNRSVNEVAMNTGL